MPENQGNWSFTLDKLNNKAILKVSHFTIFTIFGAALVPAQNIDNIVVFPNPFRPNDNDPRTGEEFTGTPDENNMTGVHIKGLSANSTIEIYDILGRKLQSLNNIKGTDMAIWDARNDRGDRVGSGVYFIVIKGNGQTIVKKLAIIR